MLIKKRLILITVAYWVFLVYIVAALVFWFIELDKQNRQMNNHRLSELVVSDPSYHEKRKEIINELNRKTTQYVAEGAVFLGLIILGAVFMYRAVRRQFALQRQQENLMMAITHELKTPIAVTKLNLETLQKHHLDEQKKQKLIEMTLQETNRLTALANNILVSAQLEAGKKSDLEELNFSDLVQSCVNDFMRRFPDRVWQSVISNDMEVEGDPLLLQILVNNLLENAVKYSPANSAVACTLTLEASNVTLTVSDEGPGIPPDERKKVFQKFYRIGNEETRSSKGTGLGLYLCKKIADQHGATIKIESKPGGGSVFIVKFLNES
ncbi:MAG: two-component sensor histidine kinase [Chitinophagaceae bacterium]|nr:two-component sensor histidine kinase [Chitinophagaceae bacterium]